MRYDQDSCSMRNRIANAARPAVGFAIANAYDHDRAFRCDGSYLAGNENVMTAEVCGIRVRPHDRFERSVVVGTIPSVDVTTRRARILPEMAIQVGMVTIAKVYHRDDYLGAAADDSVRLWHTQLAQGPIVRFYTLWQTGSEMGLLSILHKVFFL